MTQQGVRTIRTHCPTCSGTIPRSEGSRAERCPYCEHRSILVSTGIPELRYSLRPSMDAAEAVEAAKHELLDHDVLHRRQIDEASFEEPTLYYVPYLWLTGTRLRMLEQPVSGGSFMQQRVDTKVVIDDFEVFELAVDLKGWGLAGLDLGALLAKAHTSLPQPFDGTAMRNEGLVLVPNRSFDEGTAWADSQLSRLSVPGATGHDRVAERRRVLFVPVWNVAYAVDGQRYEARVEGLNGGLLSARGPEDERARIPMALGILVIPCFVLGKVLRIAVETGMLTIESCIAMARPGLLFISFIF